MKVLWQTIKRRFTKGRRTSGLDGALQKLDDEYNHVVFTKSVNATRTKTTIPNSEMPNAPIPHSTIADALVLVPDELNKSAFMCTSGTNSTELSSTDESSSNSSSFSRTPSIVYTGLCTTTDTGPDKNHSLKRNFLPDEEKEMLRRVSIIRSTSTDDVVSFSKSSGSTAFDLSAVSTASKSHVPAISDDFLADLPRVSSLISSQPSVSILSLEDKPSSFLHFFQCGKMQVYDEMDSIDIVGDSSSLKGRSSEEDSSEEESDSGSSDFSDDVSYSINDHDSDGIINEKRVVR